MNIKDAEELLRKYKEGIASIEEKDMLISWCQSLSVNESSALSEAALEAIVEEMSIRLHISENLSKPYKLWPRLVAAGIVLLAVSFGLLFYLNSLTPQFSATTAKNDIEPGGNKAILTLSNGVKISLSDTGNGKLADQAGISITKTKDGILVYKLKDLNAYHSSGDTSVYNTVYTPKGGQYQINLPDGTKVWLNSASSLKYPPSFSGLKERKVELNGEAYFEVSKNKKVPFRVVSNNQTVEVLGTHFNINAYEDEKDTKTTLLEGSVQVSALSMKSFKAGKLISQILKPGEQSQLANQLTGNIKITQANMEQVMAWKNGYFHFQNESLQGVMRQLSRWYDIDIVYQVKRSDDEFIGDIPRSVKLSEVLKILEMGGVHFKIEGKTLIVIK
jgi:transmembrane sensor